MISGASKRISVRELGVVRHALGTFDIVYSWGVLHHTGDMWTAIEKASSLLESGGLCVFALYRAPCKWMRSRNGTSAVRPRFARDAGASSAPYLAIFPLGCAAQGTRYRDHLNIYQSSRGMDFYHNVHDWLGGYPFEMALAAEIDRKMPLSASSQSSPSPSPWPTGCSAQVATSTLIEIKRMEESDARRRPSCGAKRAGRPR